MNYERFRSNVDNFGAEVLAPYTLLFWARYLEEYSLESVKFVRKSDDQIWVGPPAVGHPHLRDNAGNPLATVMDAGSLMIRSESDVSVVDVSASLNIGHDEYERSRTEQLVSAIIHTLQK